MDLLRALSTFVRVVETGSFSAVARENETNHSAVTRQVAQLEEHFGVRLFHRTTRHLSLTEDGENLLSHAREVIEAAGDLEDSLRGQHGKPVGRVRIGLTTGAAKLLTPRFGSLIERYPGLSVELVVRDEVDNLVEERLDLAVRYGPPADASLIAKAVGAFGRAAVASPAYLERFGAPAQPEDLLNHSCIVHDIGPASRNWRFHGPEGTEHDVEVAGSFQANNSEVVRQAVLAGHGIALLVEPQVLDDIRSGRLYRLLADYPTERREAYLVYPSRHHLPPRTRVVIDFLAERFAAVSALLADGRVWGETESVWLV